MNIATLDTIRKFFGTKLTAEDKQEIVDEAVMMTLARATNADSNIKHIEVELVQKIVQEVTGQIVSAADVRVAANSHLFEKAPLQRYLSRIGSEITIQEKLTIVKALASVIKIDGRISSREIQFFNMVTEAFDLDAANLIGLAVTET